MSSYEGNKLTRDAIVNCLSQQLDELELLKSMYPNNGEIVVSDSNVLIDIQNYIKNISEFIPRYLDFVVHLTMNDLKLEVCVTFSTFYPDEEPDIHIRCNQLNRQQETSLNIQVRDYIKSNHKGEVFVYTMISWLQENLVSFGDNEARLSEKINETNVAQDKFVRLWIYSHHIYNKKKREEVMKKAKDLALTGFCLPGKPGLICIEGSDSDCKEWWRDIKSLTWKKIMIRKTEVFEPFDQNLHQKFDNFAEIHFQNNTLRHNKHVDMSAFSKFMEERGLTQIFNDVFGFCTDINN